MAIQNSERTPEEPQRPTPSGHLRFPEETIDHHQPLGIHAANRIHAAPDHRCVLTYRTPIRLIDQVEAEPMAGYPFVALRELTPLKRKNIECLGIGPQIPRL